MTTSTWRILAGSARRKSLMNYEVLTSKPTSGLCIMRKGNRLTCINTVFSIHEAPALQGCSYLVWLGSYLWFPWDVHPHVTSLVTRTLRTIAIATHRVPTLRTQYWQFPIVRFASKGVISQLVLSQVVRCISSGRPGRHLARHGNKTKDPV